MVRAHVPLKVALVCGLMLAAGVADAQSLGDVKAVQRQADDAAIASQEKVDAMSDAADEMLIRYRNENRRIESLEEYNEQLERLLMSQRDELTSINDQIESVQYVEREILPLMQRMVGNISSFVELDLPFLREERTKRIEQLKSMMDRSDVTASEKFRRVLEAYQVENDYGRTVGTYRDDILVGGEPRTIDVLSVGRVALFYQTLDKKTSGTWDPAENAWQQLPDQYNEAIRTGIRVALDQEAPNLLELPIPVARTAQ